jgi:hypothetical protein
MLSSVSEHRHWNYMETRRLSRRYLRQYAVVSGIGTVEWSHHIIVCVCVYVGQSVRPAKAHAVRGLIEKGLPALHLEFEGGKACDIENVSRGSTMEIVCGSR